MNARLMGRKMAMVVAGAALLMAAVTADAKAGGAAALVVYNVGPAGAIDAQWVAGGARTMLADELKPGEGALPALVDTGRGRIEVRLAGAGKGRLLRQAARLQGGHVYCVFTGYGDVAVRDVTRKMLRDPSPEKLCKQLAQAQ